MYRYTMRRRRRGGLQCVQVHYEDEEVNVYGYTMRRRK